jgi:hypothetical protein
VGSNPTLSAIKSGVRDQGSEVSNRLEIGCLRMLTEETQVQIVPQRIMKSRLIHIVFALAIATLPMLSALNAETFAQKRRSVVKHLSVCGNPTLPCKTTATFEPYDLPFRMPENVVIYDTELFYAVILKSVSTANDNCDVFVPEDQRLAAQAMFPDHKVFSSRCEEPGRLSYSSTSPKARFMAVYAGTTLADANRMLAGVKATGKFPGANLRRMRAVMNGT